MKLKKLKQIVAEHDRQCSNCSLCEIGKRSTGRITTRYTHSLTRMVNPILFIGEAPGETEDALGFPFVGKSGILLDRLLSEAAITHFVITNAIACTPYETDERKYIREPDPSEIKNCIDNVYFLFQKLEPSAIVLLGKVAEKSWNLICKKYPTIVHEEFQPAYPLYHPSFILRKGGYGCAEYKRTLLKLIEIRKSVFEERDEED